MGVGPAIFESAGQRTEHLMPGVYSRSNNVTSPSGINAGNLVILGKSNGGEPLKLLSFGSLAEAKETLLDGELLQAVGYAFSGSSNFVPQRVNALRVNNGTQSTLTLQDSNNVDTLMLKSWDWGSHCNQLKYKLEEGSNKGVKISIGYKNDLKEIDDIERESIKITYLGEGYVPTVNITTEQIELKAYANDPNTTIVDPNNPNPLYVDDFTITWDECETLDDLVNRINDTEVYAAELLDNRVSVKTSELDTCTNVDVSEAATFYSNLEAVKEALESISYIGSVEIISTSSRNIPAIQSSYLYFTGGTAGTYTVSDFMDALTVLETEDVQIVTTPSTDPLVHYAISEHCSIMSNTVNRKERTAFVGGIVNESDETGIENARNLNNKLVSYVTDSGTAYNPVTGKVETISAAMVSVMLAGMESAMAISEPLTFKTLNILGFSKKRTVTNIETLIKAGIMVCQPNPENVSENVCIRALTTFQGNDDLISCERSMVREDLFMNRDLRSRYVSGIGHPNDYSVTNIISTLRRAANEWALAGYIIPKGGENVWNISVRISGDKVYLTYSRYLTAPRNFVFITATNHVYENTIEL